MQETFVREPVSKRNLEGNYFLSCDRMSRNCLSMEGARNPGAADQRQWALLTEKQRACLDLVLERKTSKQIARELGISRYTVDQRIAAARKILAAANRDDAAIRYAQLKSICDRIAYDPVELPIQPSFAPSDFPDDDPPQYLDVHDRQKLMAGLSGGSLSSGTIWRHDHVLTARFMITAAMLMVVVISLLGGLGIAEALTRLISG